MTPQEISPSHPDKKKGTRSLAEDEWILAAKTIVENELEKATDKNKTEIKKLLGSLGKISLKPLGKALSNLWKKIPTKPKRLIAGGLVILAALLGAKIVDNSMDINSSQDYGQQKGIPYLVPKNIESLSQSDYIKIIKDIQGEKSDLTTQIQDHTPHKEIQQVNTERPMPIDFQIKQDMPPNTNGAISTNKDPASIESPKDNLETTSREDLTIIKTPPIVESIEETTSFQPTPETKMATDILSKNIDGAFYRYVPPDIHLSPGNNWAQEHRSHAHELLPFVEVFGQSGDKQKIDWVKQALLSHIRKQNIDGGYTYIIKPDSKPVDITDNSDSGMATIPWIAYESWRLYQFESQQGSPDKQFLQEAFESGKRNSEWWNNNRRDSSGLYYWKNNWESVRDLEDLPTWSETGGAENQYALDLNCYMVVQFDILSKMAHELDKTDEANYYQQQAELLKSKIRSSMWDSENNTYYGIGKPNSNLGGQKVKVDDLSMFLTLWSGIATPEQAQSIVDYYLKNPQKFGPAANGIYYGIPSLARDNPSFNAEHWKGASWPEFTYLIIQGLRNYNFIQLANQISIDSQNMFYSSGSWEYYDPNNGNGRGIPSYVWGPLALMPSLEKVTTTHNANARSNNITGSNLQISDQSTILK